MLLRVFRTAIFVVLWVVLSSSLVATGYFLHEFNRPRPSLLHPPRFKLLLSPVHHQRLAVVANGDRDLGIAEKAWPRATVVNFSLFAHLVLSLSDIIKLTQKPLKMLIRPHESTPNFRLNILHLLLIEQWSLLFWWFSKRPQTL